MTLLEGVEKLEPATFLRWRDGSVQRERYWRDSPPELHGHALRRRRLKRFREALRAAVHRQMMSDRPIGVMLSGGVDSAAITAFMAERSSQVKTFTVGFEGGGDADETALARETARLFATDHHEMIIDDTDFAQELPRAIEMLEEPVGTSSALGFRAVSRLAAEHVPVLLSGQGADELLGGLLALRGGVDRRNRAAAADAGSRARRRSRDVRACSHRRVWNAGSARFAIRTCSRASWTSTLCSPSRRSRLSTGPT